MPKKVKKVGVKKKAGYLYFIDKQGDVSCAKMSRRGRVPGKRQKIVKVKKTRIKKQPGYLYFIDKQGDISCARMKRGRKKK